MLDQRHKPPITIAQLHIHERRHSTDVFEGNQILLHGVGLKISYISFSSIKGVMEFFSSPRARYMRRSGGERRM
jgi:hypothetical protein